MNCKICGFSEFCTNDGITYCTECQSQVETTQAEEAVELTFSRDFGSASGTTKKASTEKKKEYSDWITAEGFNYILFQQVSALIELGASPLLKKTVMHIWTKYLQKCEIAFRTDYKAHDGKPCVGPLPAKRDIKVLYGDKKITKRKRKFSKLEETNSESLVKNEISDESMTDAATDGSCLSDGESIKSEKEEKLQKMYSSHCRKLLKKSRLNPSKRYLYDGKVFNMNLQKTLSISYLGLLYTEDQLSLLDLIRLTYEEKIPYLNVIDKFPPSLKIQNADIGTFLAYNVPDAYSILKMSREMVKFLKLPEFKEPSVFLSVSHFVKDLNFPDDLKSVVKILVKRFDEQKPKTQGVPFFHNVPQHYQALAFIIVALKMLFVLDNEFEIQHSEVMKKLNAMSKDKKYFEWSEWKKQCMIKEYLFLCENPGYSTVNNLDGLSADRIISRYPFTRLPSAEVSQNSSDALVIKNNIKNLLSNVVKIPSFSGCRPTSFPLRNAVDSLIEEWNTLPMFKETQEIDFNFLKRDFSACSLSFNPLQLDKNVDELFYLLMTSLYLPEAAIDLTNKHNKIDVNYQKIIKTTSSYWYINYPYDDDTTTAFFSGWFQKLPSSFQWLINFICKYAYCNNIILYKEVVRIEKILFLKQKAVHQRRLSQFKNKLIVEF